MSLNPTVEWGTFYSGTRQQIATKLALRVRPGVIVYLNHEWNRIDLPEGSLRTQVFEATPELQFSQWISLVNTVQFDTVSSVLGWQSRFRWILKPGNDLFLGVLAELAGGSRREPLLDYQPTGGVEDAVYAQVLTVILTQGSGPAGRQRIFEQAG